MTSGSPWQDVAVPVREVQTLSRPNSWVERLAWAQLLDLVRDVPRAA